MDIERLLTTSGVEFNGMSVTEGRGRNPLREWTFLVRGEYADEVAKSVRVALEGSSLSLVAVIWMRDQVFECSVRGLADKTEKTHD